MSRSAVSTIGAVVIVVLLILSWPFAVVPTGSRGLVLNFGAVAPDTLEPGLHFRIPFKQRVIPISVQQQTVKLDYSGNGGAYTKDGQPVDFSVALTYSVDPLHAVDLYAKIGTDYENKIIRPTLESLVKAELPKYLSIELPTHHADIEQAVNGQIKEALASSYIQVEQFRYLNEQFAQSYEDAINSKKVAEQKALEEVAKTNQVEQQKQQSILQAQAQAETSKLQADALNSQNGDKVIELKKAEAMLVAANKWDGKMPGIMIPGQSLPFIQLPQTK